MTELAHAYYKERAARLKLTTIPAILDGEPHALDGGCHHVSIHALDTAAAVSVGEELQHHLTSIESYLLDTLPEPVAKVLPVDRELSAARNESFIQTFIGALLVPPNSVTTGKLKKFQLEALAEQEIGPKAFAVLRKTGYEEAICPALDFETDLEAYLHLSAELTSGISIDVGGLMMVRIAQFQSYDLIGEQAPPPVLMPVYRGMPDPENQKRGSELKRRLARISGGTRGRPARYASTTVPRKPPRE